MLDSKIIKKYSKLGLWSKILLVVFFAVMVVGAIVGYFLHNNNIYAQQPAVTDKVTVTFADNDNLEMVEGITCYVENTGTFITPDADGNWSYQIEKGKELFIKVILKSDYNDCDVACYIEDGENLLGKEGDRFKVGTINGDVTVNVSVFQSKEVPVKLGTINGKTTDMSLRQFVSNIVIRTTPLNWGGIWKETGELTDNDKIKIRAGNKSGKDIMNKFEFTMADEQFSVTNVTFVWDDGRTEVKSFEKDNIIRIGTVPKEIRINLKGNDYKERADYTFENSNSSVKEEVFLKGKCKVFTGPDVVRNDGKWEVVTGTHAEIFLKEGYTILKNSLGTHSDKSGLPFEDDLPITRSEKKPDKGSGQEFFMKINKPRTDGGIISVYVVGENTLYDINFTSGTNCDLGDGVQSITIGGRDTDKTTETIDSEVVTKFSTEAIYVKGDTSTEALEVKITFNSGYTLNTLNGDNQYDINNIMNLGATPKGFSVTLGSNVEEKRDEGGNYSCEFALSISHEGEDKNPKLGTISSALALVLREYTIKFVQIDKDDKEVEYDYGNPVFSVSKSTENTNKEIDDSYETKKDYIRVSSSAESQNVYFDITLANNYADCKDSLTYTSDNKNFEVTKEGKGEDAKLYFKILPNAEKNITVKIENIELNKIYVPETIDRDDILKEYNVEVSATLNVAEDQEYIEINGKKHYWYYAEGDTLIYDLKGSTSFINWAKGKSASSLFTNPFFRDGRVLYDTDDTSASVKITNFDSSKIHFVDADNGEKYRVINDTQIQGPALKEVTAHFRIDKRYKEFFNFIKALKKDNGAWTVDDPISWSDEMAGGQVEAKVVIKYHILSDATMDEFVGLEGTSDADIRTAVSGMNVRHADASMTEVMPVSTEINEEKIDAFPEEKYKLINLQFKGTVLYDKNINDYYFDILNIEYPSNTAYINVPNNMATFGITDGFLDSSWKAEDLGGGNQRLQATYNYNSNISFTVQANSGYTISEVKDEIKIYSTEDGNENGTDEINDYNYTEYQNEKNETVIGITLDNVKTNLYIYVEFGPTHRTITHSKIEGANSYRVEKTETGGKEEYRCKEMILGRNTVPDGSSYYFLVEAQTGYNIESLEISSTDAEQLKEITSEVSIIYDQGNERSSKIKVYEIKEVRKNQTISGTIKKEKCSVTFNLDKEYPEALSYKYEGQVLSDYNSRKINVDYGDNIEFSTQIEEKYNRSNYKIMLFEKGSEENGRELNLVNGVYTISNIVTDKDVRIEGIEINRYSINLVKNDAAEYLNNRQDEIFGVQTVEYNGNYEFTLKPNTGYAIGESTQVICTSEDGTKKTLNPDKSGKYKLSNVKEDFTINIMNVDDIYYTVTLIPVEGVTYVNDKDAVVSGSFQIKHGNNFEFGVNVDDAYDDSKAGMYIVINDGKSQNLRSQILYSGRYTINNITEDAKIKVGNIRKNTYTVTLNKVEGMDFYNDSNKIISGDNTVSHGDSLSFKVNLYPAYADSKVKIMLGTQELSADESGFYTVKNVIENKIVTVNGVEETEESKLTNTINNLPDNVTSLSDVDDVISASRIYESFTDEQKARVGNVDKLKRLQEQVKKFHHVSNGLTIEGVDWNIKLFAIPIDNSMEVYTRLYKKLSSEYILSLYNVYLWDTLKDVKYTLPEGQSAVVSLPTPEMTYFEKPTGIHEKDNGKLDYLSLILGSDQVSFTTDSFSPMGIVANRTSTPGRSSLLDTWDANVQAIKDYALSNTNSSGSRNENSASSSEYISDDDSSSEDNDGNTGNISEKFKSRNNPVTPRGSAIRLLLVLLILILLSIIIIIIIENMKKNKDVKK